MQITESATVADVASAVPSSVRVFQRYGIDFCCGGKTALAAACQAQGVSYAELVDAIDASAQHAGALLSELRTITGGYVAPEWACQTFRALYHGLADLEAAMHVHVHLENNVLFPRAVALTRVAEGAVG